jgi:chorismate mutase
MDQQTLDRELAKQRQRIDFADQGILRLLSKRMRLTRTVGEIKKKNGLPSLDDQRWNELIENRVELANKLGLDADFVRTIYEIIHQQSLHLEEELKGKWT